MTAEGVVAKEWGDYLSTCVNSKETALNFVVREASFGKFSSAQSISMVMHNDECNFSHLPHIFYCNIYFYVAHAFGYIQKSFSFFRYLC